MGPIGVKAHLARYLPSHPITTTSADAAESLGTVSAAAWGSASILPISWAYIRLMGPIGLRRASEVAILNANYMAARLKDHYKILFRGAHGFNAHEFILDTREFKTTANVDAIDITKRLQDYGLHAPTVSWPVGNTLMLEPTESEDREMMDNYCDALISIREEIREVEEGKYSRDSNVLKVGHLLFLSLYIIILCPYYMLLRQGAPHTMKMVTADEWAQPYSRTKAAFPAVSGEWLSPRNKVWPGSARQEEIHGDKNVVANLYEPLATVKKK
jgi:glycine dehydrogenase